MQLWPTFSKSLWLKSRLSPGLAWRLVHIQCSTVCIHSAPPSSRRACLLSQSASESRGLHGLFRYDWKQGGSNEETRQPTPAGNWARLQARGQDFGVPALCVCSCVTMAEPLLFSGDERPTGQPPMPMAATTASIAARRCSCCLAKLQEPTINHTASRPNVMEHSANETDANQTGNGTGLAGGGSAVQPDTPLTPLAESGGSGKSALVQPWKCFWPPAFGSNTYRRLEDEHPNVLAWRFDITRPFDRPWRHWTGPATVEGGGCPSPLARGLSKPPSKWRISKG